MPSTISWALTGSVALVACVACWTQRSVALAAGPGNGQVSTGASASADMPTRFVLPTNLDQDRWHRIEIGGAFSGRTVAARVGETVLFFHPDGVSRLDVNGQTWEHRQGLLQDMVDDSFHVAVVNGRVFVLSAAAPHLFELDFNASRLIARSPLPAVPRKGARIAVDGVSGLFAIPAGGHPRDGGSKKLFRYSLADDSWQSLPNLEAVNNPGYFSSALFSRGDGVFTYGDHHVARYDIGTGEWNRLFNVMRYRPAIGRGGMSALDSEQQNLYVTLGNASNSIGVVSLSQGIFHYLRPRLPFALADAGETLFAMSLGEEEFLFLLSNRERAIYAIRSRALLRIGTEQVGKLADHRSHWESQNVSVRGAHGGLFRHQDSYASGVFLQSHFYYLRKNVLRRVDPLTSRISPVQGMYPFHRLFSTRGAAITSDGDATVYLYTGHDHQFFAVDVLEQGLPQDSAGSYLATTRFREPALGGVRDLAPLPEVPGANSAMHFFKGSVIAILSGESRRVYRYEPVLNEWMMIGSLPEGARLDDSTGLALVTAGEELLLVAHDRVFVFTATGANDAEAPVFEHRLDLKFSFPDDGGMVAWDPELNRLYVSLGAGGRQLGVVDLTLEQSYVSSLEFPDAVSVAGQRMFVLDGMLYIYRGHDSAELWRVRTDRIAGPAN